MKSRTINIIFWTFITLFTAGILTSAVPSALSLPYAVDYFTNILHYPEYLLPFTGFAKLLGIVALVAPGYPRVKEWAFAGFVFDFTGAMYSKMAIGEPFSDLIPVIIAFILLAGVYVSYHKRLRFRSVNVIGDVA